MNDSVFFSILWATALVLVSISVNAELFDRGNGLIYDSVQDLTWTQDAGMSGYRTSWDDAMAWAANLEFGGFDDWRLPVTTQFDDPTCSGDVRAAGVYVLFYESRLDCRGGEMELLTYLHDPWTNPLFINVNRTRYWMAAPYRDWIDPCIYYPDYDVPCTIENDNGIRTNFYWQWGFTGFDGLNGPAFKTTLRGTNDRYAWAVRDGDVITPALPGDINFDGEVTAADYLLLTQFVLGTGSTPTTAELNAGDMNSNGQLDAGDLVLHLRTVMGLI